MQNPSGYATLPDHKSKRDQNPGEANADQQKMNTADREIAAKIRRSMATDIAGGIGRVVNQMSVTPTSKPETARNISCNQHFRRR
jgi:hypothetical protein